MIFDGCVFDPAIFDASACGGGWLGRRAHYVPFTEDAFAAAAENRAAERSREESERMMRLVIRQALAEAALRRQTDEALLTELDVI